MKMVSCLKHKQFYPKQKLWYGILIRMVKFFLLVDFMLIAIAQHVPLLREELSWFVFCTSQVQIFSVDLLF